MKLNKQFFNKKYKKIFLIQSLVILTFLSVLEISSRVFITRKDFSGPAIIEMARKIRIFYRINYYLSNNNVRKKNACIHSLVQSDLTYDFSSHKYLVNSLRDKYENGFSQFVNLAKDISKNNFLVIYIPSSKLKNKHSKYFEELSKKYNVEFLNLSNLLTSSGEYEDWTLSPENGHLSRYGNRKIAKYLYNRIDNKLQIEKNINIISIPNPKNLGSLLPKKNDIWVAKYSMPYRVTSNSMGFRNGEEIKSRPLITIFGDSFTFGPYLANHDTYPLLLQKLFRNSKKLAYNSTQVVNAGVNGSTIFHQIEMLKKSYDLKPNLIILQVLDNDIYGVASSKLMVSNPVYLPNKKLFDESKEEEKAYEVCNIEE